MARRQRSRDRMRAERAASNETYAPAPPSASDALPSSSSAIEPPLTSHLESEREALARDSDHPFSAEHARSAARGSALDMLPAMSEPSLEVETLAATSTRTLEPETPPPTSAPAFEPDATDALDAEIVRAASGGDARRALELCAELHAASVGRLCMALLGSQADADAVTEEVLLEAYRRADELRAQSSLRGFLLGLARGACVRRVERRRAKRRTGADDLPPSSEPSSSARARALLQQIRPSDREALVLRFAANASTREVAVACNLETTEAQRRVSRALSRLRDALESEASDD